MKKYYGDKNKIDYKDLGKVDFRDINLEIIRNYILLPLFQLLSYLAKNLDLRDIIKYDII